MIRKFGFREAILNRTYVAGNDAGQLRASLLPDLSLAYLSRFSENRRGNPQSKKTTRGSPRARTTRIQVTCSQHNITSNITETQKRSHENYVFLTLTHIYLTTSLSSPSLP